MPDVLRAVNACLRRWRLFVVLPALIGAAAVALTVRKPERYTSEAALMAQGGASDAGMSSLVQRFGFALPGNSNPTSPQFYAFLLRSEGFLRTLAGRSYEVADPEVEAPAPVPDLLGIEEQDPARREEATVSALRERIAVTVDDETGIVQLAVTTRWPALSASLATDLIDLVHEFNLAKRQTQGRAEREFTERRLREAQQELEEARRALTNFQLENRLVQSSPALLAEGQVLMTQVEFRQQVYLSLAQMFEQAKIEEVRTTPMVTVVDPPRLPARPDPEGLLSVLLLSLLLGIILAAMWAITSDYLARLQAARSDSVDEFRRAVSDLGSDLRRGPRGWVGRASARGAND